MSGFLALESGFRSALKEAGDFEFELYVESLDLSRFPDERYRKKLMELYREKYSSRKIDLIVAIQVSALEFLSEYHLEPFRNVPVILSGLDPKFTGDPTVVPHAVAVTGKLDFSGTLSLAVRLHPEVRKVFVVAGTSPFDRSLEAMAREELRSFDSRVELCYLSGLPIDDLSHRISSLPEQSLVLYLAVFQDGSGRNFNSPEALALFSGLANAPIYSLADTYIGSGIVGGHIYSSSALGANVACEALHILAGDKPDSPCSSVDSGNRYIFDARRLKRWGINEDKLPEGSEVRYRDVSVWETHRRQIVGTITLIILQVFLISALVVSLRRQKRADLAVRRAAEEWQATFDATTDLIMLLDREFRILRVNAAVSSFTGIDPDGILGNHCYKVMHGCTSIPDDCPCARVFETKRHEEAILHDGKRDMWLLVAADPVLDEKGQITSVVHSVRNVTEYRRAEEAIKASEEFNRAVLASLKNHVAILDRNGTVLAVSEAWEHPAGRNEAPLLANLGAGDNYLEACRRFIQETGTLGDQALGGVLSVLDGKSETFSLEYSCGPASEPQWFLMSVTPFKSPGGGVVVSHTNITERKNAELEAQLHREELAHVTRIVTVSELATSLTHEINQPMTAILCNAEAALRFLSCPAPNLDEVRTILADIIQDDRRAGEVIRRMRTLIKKESSQHEPLNLNDTVQETIALVRNASFLEGVSIVTELESGMPTVQADRVQLQQVVMNLLLNATAAMKDTPAALRKVTIKTAIQDDRAVVVSVRDLGTGIAINDLHRLFQPFYTTKPDGLGMGLSISRTIIETHGGEIMAENNDGGGASFSFTLPLLDRGELP